MRTEPNLEISESIDQELFNSDNNAEAKDLRKKRKSKMLKSTKSRYHPYPFDDVRVIEQKKIKNSDSDNYDSIDTSDNEKDDNSRYRYREREELPNANEYYTAKIREQPVKINVEDILTRLAKLESSKMSPAFMSDPLNLLEQVPPPILRKKKESGDQRLMTTLNKIHKLKSLIGVEYEPKNCILTYLRQISQSITCIAGALEPSEYNMLLLSMFKKEEREKIISSLEGQDAYDILPTDLQALIVQILGKRTDLASRCEAFWGYNPATDPLTVTLHSLIFKINTLAQNTNIDRKSIYAKILSCLPVSIQPTLTHRVLTIQQYNPDFIPNTQDMMRLLRDLDKNIGEMLTFRKRKRREDNINKVMDNIGMIGSLENNFKNMGFDSKAPKPNEFLNHNEARGMQRNFNKSYNNPKLYNPYKPSIPTCCICLYKGHVYDNCPFTEEKRICTMCASREHIAPQCPIYKGIVAVPKACSICQQIGQKRHHPETACLLIKESAMNQGTLGESKNGMGRN